MGQAKERAPNQCKEVMALREQKLEMVEIVEQGLAEVPAENPHITKEKKYGRGRI